VAVAAVVRVAQLGSSELSGRAPGDRSHRRRSRRKKALVIVAAVGRWAAGVALARETGHAIVDAQGEPYIMR
jgi:hypothetical protein